MEYYVVIRNELTKKDVYDVMLGGNHKLQNDPI